MSASRLVLEADAWALDRDIAWISGGGAVRRVSILEPQVKRVDVLGRLVGSGRVRGESALVAARRSELVVASARGIESVWPIGGRTVDAARVEGTDLVAGTASGAGCVGGEGWRWWRDGAQLVGLRGGHAALIVRGTVAIVACSDGTTADSLPLSGVRRARVSDGWSAWASIREDGTVWRARQVRGRWWTDHIASGAVATRGLAVDDRGRIAWTDDRGAVFLATPPNKTRPTGLRVASVVGFVGDGVLVSADPRGVALHRLAADPDLHVGRERAYNGAPCAHQRAADDEAG